MPTRPRLMSRSKTRVVATTSKSITFGSFNRKIVEAPGLKKLSWGETAPTPQ